MRVFVCLAVALLVAASAAPAEAGGRRSAKKAERRERKRQAIDQMAADALGRLLQQSPVARTLHERAVGWAAFDNTRVSLGLTGGGGRGVAIDKATEARSYMRMATGGVNVGLGVQKYQVVFLFEDQATMEHFVHRGWEAETSASAVAGTAGANAEANFDHGLAVFQLTEAGLMLQADISGTRYWQNEELNQDLAPPAEPAPEERER